MKVYRSFEEIKYDPASVLTVGTFDGVHLGHQKIISELLDTAEKDSLRPVLLTIHPHPQIVLQKKDRPPVMLLTTIEERLYLFEKYEVENVLVIPFSYEFSQISGEEFVRDYLHSKVGMKKMLIGYDHMFGKDRSGNIALLEKLSDELDFSVSRIQAFEDKERIISSTEIRKAIEDRRIEEVNNMLGHPFLINAEVVHGQGRAAQLGYPTANFNNFNPNKIIPGTGVYFVRSKIYGKEYFGMANIGYRPTLTNDTELTLEVNYFEFNSDIYGETIAVEFLNFLRKEHKFPSVDDLLEQIGRDRAECLKLAEKYKN